MTYVTTVDGAQIFYKDWGSGMLFGLEPSEVRT